MKNYGFKVRWVIIALFATLSLYGGEAKGYKIVLASYGSFDEAKSALSKVNEKLTDKEKGLQEKEKFEIVARASGKAYILAVEPIESEEGSKVVLKQFKTIYPDAYVNGYFGPTPGSISLSPQSNVAPIEANTTQESTTPIEENVTQEIEEVKESDTVVTPIAAEEPKSSNTMLYIAILLMIIGASIFYVKKRFFSDNEISNDEFLPMDSLEEAGALNEEHRSAVAKTIISSNTETTTEIKKDIFYTFKKNMFFITLLKELQVAAQHKEMSRCNELMDELMRYQKNFQKSEIMGSMHEMVGAKEFEKLAALIGSELE